jgi:hypothetical protein
VALEKDLRRIAERAAVYAAEGEDVAGIVPAEPASGIRLYVCAYGGDDATSWLVLDATGVPVSDRELVRDAVSIAALCEVAEESAGGGHLSELRARLTELRETDNPAGIEEAEAAAAALAETLQPEPRVASGAYLDALGFASRRLEQALGESGASPFAAAMQAALGSVEELAADVEGNYKLPLE